MIAGLAPESSVNRGSGPTAEVESGAMRMPNRFVACMMSVIAVTSAAYARTAVRPATFNGSPVVLTGNDSLTISEHDYTITTTSHCAVTAP